VTLAFKTKRFRIYRGRNSKTYLCVVSARDKAHALEIARRTFFLGIEAFSVEESAVNGGAR
jgi:hypothetical protein